MTRRRRAMHGLRILTRGLLLALAALGTASFAAAAEPTHRLAIAPYTDPAFFPIGVWLQNPANAERYRAIGVNTFVGLWKGPTAAQLARLREAGMWVICEQNDLALNLPDRAIVIGWLYGDEPDNAQRRELGLGYGPPVPPAKVIDEYREMRAKDPTRPVLLNFGQGVAWDGWQGRGSRSGHPEDYPLYVKGGDILSFDIYPVTHTHPDVAGRLELVARGVERLRAWAKDGQTIWHVVGATRINNAEVTPTPQQICAQVWMGLVHGSRGVIYFVHQFKPRFIEAALFEDPDVVREVTRINGEIAELAPVLNSATVDGAVAVDSADASAPVAALVKRYGGQTYVFAIAMTPKTTRATFRDLSGGDGAAATVIGENCTLARDGGRFTDTFGPYAVHLYRY